MYTLLYNFHHIQVARVLGAYCINSCYRSGGDGSVSKELTPKAEGPELTSPESTQNATRGACGLGHLGRQNGVKGSAMIWQMGGLALEFLGEIGAGLSYQRQVAFGHVPKGSFSS